MRVKIVMRRRETLDVPSEELFRNLKKVIAPMMTMMMRMVNRACRNVVEFANQQQKLEVFIKKLNINTPKTSKTEESSQKIEIRVNFR